jgi:hypothetical protein
LPAMSRVELMDACDMQKYFWGIYWVETNTTISRWNEVTSVFWIVSQNEIEIFLNICDEFLSYNICTCPD